MPHARPSWFHDHPRLTAALVLAVGLPVLAIAGCLLTAVAGAALAAWLQPGDAPASLWLWSGGLLLTGLPLWLLVVRCVRLGGLTGAALGVAYVLAMSGGLWLLGWLEQALRPQADMAGIGFGLLSALLAAAALVALVMSLAAAWVVGARRS